MSCEYCVYMSVCGCLMDGDGGGCGVIEVYFYSR